MSQKDEGSFQARKGPIPICDADAMARTPCNLLPSQCGECGKVMSLQKDVIQEGPRVNVVLFPALFPSLLPLTCGIRGHDLRKPRRMQRPHVAMSTLSPRVDLSDTSISPDTWEGMSTQGIPGPSFRLF